MTAKPKVSVLIPTYNSEKYIVDTIKSVLNQSYRNFEIIITDDCSTDKTVELIKEIKSTKVKTYVFTRNLGTSAALNNCIQKSNGKYLAVLGSDDLFSPNKLRAQIDYLENNHSVGAVFTLAELINDNGEKYLDESGLYGSFSVQSNRTRHEWLRYFFSHMNVLCASSSVIRKSVQLEVGMYDERLLQLQDFDMWIRLCMKSEIFIIQEQLTKYRIKNNFDNISSRAVVNQVRLKFELKEILKNYLKIKSQDELNTIFKGEFKNKNLSAIGAKCNIALLAVATDSNIHQLFGIEQLYDLMNDKQTKLFLEKKFGFYNSDLYKIAGKIDVFNYSGFKSITSSKFFALWQFVKNPSGIKKMFIFRILKKIKYTIYLLLMKVFSRSIKFIITLKFFRLAPILYTLKRNLQLFFYSDSLDSATHYVQSPTLISHRQYMTENNIKHNIIYPSELIKTYPPHYLKDRKRNAIAALQPEIFVSYIRNANIIGSSSIILKDSFALHETTPHLTFDRLDLKSDVIREHYKNRVLIDSIKSGVAIEKGIMMSGTASYNYYHWLIEFLPKYHLIEKLNLNEYPLLIDEEVLYIPQLRQALDAVNTLNLPFIPLKKNSNYLIQDLVYPSLMSWTAINIRSNLTMKSLDSVTSPIAINYLLKKLKPTNRYKGRRKIYLSRGGTVNRKFNERDVLEMCLRHKYEIIDTQRLSFREQIELFSQAKIIVGASGAAMTNMLFAPTGTKILCLKNSKIDLTVFSNLAEYLHHKIIYLPGTIDVSDKKSYYYQKRFRINPKKLDEALSYMESID